MSTHDPARVGLAGRIASATIDSKLTPLLIAASLGLGALALLSTPREEEPQIRVPMIDVSVSWPGADPSEIERRVIEPLERALWGMPGLDHLYSTASSGGALLTARFLVGEPYEPSLVKVYERAFVAASGLPPGTSPPRIELRTIDDVLFLTLTLWSPQRSSDELRPIAAELAQELAEVPETARVELIGGASRRVRVEPDPERLAAAGLSWQRLADALAGGAARLSAGTAVRANREQRVEAEALYASADEINRVVVGVRDGKPIYARDVARVLDGPGESTDAVFFLPGQGATSSEPGRRVTGRGGLPASRESSSASRGNRDPAGPAGRGSELVGGEYQAVTLSLAKRPGANATALSERVLGKVEELRPRLLPTDVRVTPTRDYGHTAAEKSSELVDHLLIATLSVVVLISLAMGWRSGLVVGIAVPVTLALTLFIYFLAGYTLNRVTLFALIFSIGILVDDAIVVVENIERHVRKAKGHLLRTAIAAVDEVGNPTILATFTVIAAILPMAFVRGLMGPYMRPIPTGASAAMLFSLAVAFIVSPWAAYRIFRRKAHTADEGHEGDEEEKEGFSTRIYRRTMQALLGKPLVRWSFFAAVLLALVGAAAMVGVGLVKVKMLPFDNKSELQVLVDHDPGTPLEITLATAREIGRALTAHAEVTNVQIYAGAPAPFNFNGLVRHYFLRRSPAGADLQVNLVAKDERDVQSHDFAKALRPELVAIAHRRGARVKVVEMPPGPPVLDTLVAEIYGPGAAARAELAASVREIFESTPGVVDVDDSLDAESTRLSLALDREKAALKGITAVTALETLAASGAGRELGRLDVPEAREVVPIALQLSAADRADLDRRLSLRVDSPAGAVSLSELVTVEREAEPRVIHHKDLKPVTYVFGDLAGQRESPVYALAALNQRLDALPLASNEQGPSGTRLERYSISPPSTSDRLALKWDGEWQITYEVFRDLGIAFAIVLVLIALLVIGWFQSFSVPLAILLPIPLSLIGILPGHFFFGAFFTATSMIGFIAGAGIIVRNSIILVDFIELELRQGAPLEQAVIDAGAVRFRPMLLTAAAVVVGSLVILFDPIFQGLAISLMMGEVAATFLSRLAVPVVYYLLAKKNRARALRLEGQGVGA